MNEKAKQTIVPLLLIVVFGLAFAAGVKSLGSGKKPAAKDAKVTFASGVDAAFDQAKAEGKVVMIDFTAEWCGPCQMMKKEAFTDDSVAELLSGVVPVQIDVDAPGADEKWMEKNQDGAIPTIVFFSADGDEIGRTVGYGGVEAFKEEVSDILARA